MTLFSGKREFECMVVFDVGSGSVGGALVLHSKKSPPTVLYSTRSEILFKQEITASRLLSLCLRALSEVVLALTHEGFDKAGFSQRRLPIVEALVSLSAPWTASKTSFLRVKNERPVRITEAMFRMLLADDRRNTVSSVPKGGIEIEHKLVKSVLNGYETAEPYGKEALTAEFTTLSSYSLPKVTEKIADIISHLLHTNRTSFHSFSLLSFTVLRELFPLCENFIFLDVSAEQTEVSVVKKNVSLETISFPFGKNHLIRALERERAMPPSGAESFISLYAEGKAEGKLSAATVKSIEGFGEEWLLHFYKAMSSFSEEVFLPETLYLTADAHIAPLMEHVISKGDFTKFTLASAPFHTIFIDANVLTPYIRTTATVTADPFISLIALYGARLRS